MTKEEFEKLECTFSCEFDPKTKAPLTQTWTKEDFNQFGDDDDDSLFKLCVQEEIQKVDRPDNTRNYQKSKESYKVDLSIQF